MTDVQPSCATEENEALRPTHVGIQRDFFRQIGDKVAKHGRIVLEGLNHGGKKLAQSWGNETQKNVQGSGLAGTIAAKKGANGTGLGLKR